ncbi:SAM hydrolase/SAM-dependent halogenase family protein [Candidatus Poriferisocius sp.]|uniref:SAM hydrolase/SAM-dependent halogenase family protein n=1 Tax=Candidatus Poriferisocius sp. TaxID=3101276 RepID=UPI003B01E9E6
MTLRYDTISFLSDYGLADEFVGVVKSVIRSVAPEVVVVDITHNISPHDVRAGGLALARSAQYLMPGVVLAVVDPGVGGNRRAVAIEVGDGTSVLVGPDNGLLAPAVAMVGGASRAVELTAQHYHLASLGPTFAGRDVFAPVAAHLCMGADLADVGELIPVHSLTPGIVPVSRVDGDRVFAEVMWIDRYGNLQLNLDPHDIERLGDELRLTAGDVGRNARRVGSFSDLGSGELGVLVDSYGLVAVAANRGSSALELNCVEGDAITVESGGSAPATPVQLQPRQPEALA